jgi:hypothetical protein
VHSGKQPGQAVGRWRKICRKPGEATQQPVENKGNNQVMKFSPTRAAGRPDEPWTALARRPSTTLSTAFVDKRKTVRGSLVYVAFLQTIATTRAN